MRTLLLFLIFHYSSALFAQQEEAKLQVRVMAGYRSMPIPGCYCWFKPTEFEAKLRTNVLFGGFSIIHKNGLTYGLEGGYFKRSFVQAGVSDSQQWNVYYYQSETKYKGKYINSTLGFTFGNGQLKFSLAGGIDFHFEKSYQRIDTFSRFTNIQQATQTYPEVPPIQTVIDTSQYILKNRSLAPLFGFRFAYDMNKRLGVIAGSELYFWRGKVVSTGNNAERRLVSYRIALTYKFDL